MKRQRPMNAAEFLRALSDIADAYPRKVGGRGASTIEIAVASDGTFTLEQFSTLPDQDDREYGSAILRARRGGDRFFRVAHYRAALRWFRRQRWRTIRNLVEHEQWSLHAELARYRAGENR